MADWVEVARRNHMAAQAALADTVNSQAISIPVADSEWTAPGWLFDGVFFSTIPDVVYPWDPAVLRFIREFDRDAVPLVVRHVYRYSNYHERGYISDPVIILRHGIARHLRDPLYRTHSFSCDMASTGRRFPVPNLVRDIWSDRDAKPQGSDLPGPYLPFDFAYARALQAADEAAVAAMKSARRVETQDGPQAESAGQAYVTALKQADASAKESRKDQENYKLRDIHDYYSEEPSDVEWKEKMVGNF